MSKRKPKKPSKLKLPWYISLLIFMLITLFGERYYHRRPNNFREAKHHARAIFASHPVTFYCGCDFDTSGFVKLKQCGYKSRFDKARAKKIEFEHIVPAHYFGHHLPCWSKALCVDENGKIFKGRKCCQMIDASFRLMEADLHNIVPAIGEINKVRSNYHFKELGDIKLTRFGQCHLKIDFKHRTMEPPDVVKGLIARSYLYMATRYQLILNEDEIKLFGKWNTEFPPDAWEKQWNIEVNKIQGNPNPLR